MRFLFFLSIVVWASFSSAQGPDLNPDPARFEEAVRRYEASDSQDAAQPGEILFLGSSTIENWPLAECFPDLPVVNRGLGGSHMSDLIVLVSRLTAKRCPRTIVLYEGDNDVAAGKTPGQIVCDFQVVIRKLQQRFPNACILLISVKPSPARWSYIETMRDTNARLKDLASKCRNVSWVSIVEPMLNADGKPRAEIFGPDELHMNEEGYRLWSSLLRPHLTGK
jgi:lysophospholipase L1-like esterase